MKQKNNLRKPWTKCRVGCTTSVRSVYTTSIVTYSIKISEKAWHLLFQSKIRNELIIQSIFVRLTYLLLYTIYSITGIGYRSGRVGTKELQSLLQVWHSQAGALLWPLCCWHWRPSTVSWFLRPGNSKEPWFEFDQLTYPGVRLQSGRRTR